MDSIRIAIAGVGNCASSLIQGIYYYRDKTENEAVGLMNWDIGGYKPGDIEVAVAFDIDERKVGKDVSDAVFALPNCTTIFHRDIPETGTLVRMGPVLDGFSDHMKEYDDKYTFVPADAPEPDMAEVVRILRDGR
ncbi:Inositol-3-phosphate synthase [subsurface metagenome]